MIDKMKQSKSLISDFLYHYKGITFVSILIIFVIGILIFDFFSIDHRDKWSLYIINNTLPNEEVEYITSTFSELQNAKNSGNQKISYQINTDLAFQLHDNEADFAQLGKFTALVASGEMDILIGTYDIIKHYTDFDGFQNLDQVIPNYKDDFVYTSNDNIQILDLSGTIFDGYFLAIPKKSEKVEISKGFIDYIFEKEE